MIYCFHKMCLREFTTIEIKQKCDDILWYCLRNVWIAFVKIFISECGPLSWAQCYLRRNSIVSRSRVIGKFPVLDETWGSHDFVFRSNLMMYQWSHSRAWGVLGIGLAADIRVISTMLPIEDSQEAHRADCVVETVLCTFAFWCFRIYFKSPYF